MLVMLRAGLVRYGIERRCGGVVANQRKLVQLTPSGSAELRPPEHFHVAGQYCSRPLHGAATSIPPTQVLQIVQSHGWRGYAARPDRFVRQPPMAALLPAAAWVNPPRTSFSNLHPPGVSNSLTCSVVQRPVGVLHRRSRAVSIRGGFAPCCYLRTKNPIVVGPSRACRSPQRR